MTWRGISTICILTSTRWTDSVRGFTWQTQLGYFISCTTCQQFNKCTSCLPWPTQDSQTCKIVQTELLGLRSLNRLVCTGSGSRRSMESVSINSRHILIHRCGYMLQTSSSSLAIPRPPAIDPRQFIMVPYHPCMLQCYFACPVPLLRLSDIYVINHGHVSLESKVRLRRLAIRLAMFATFIGLLHTLFALLHKVACGKKSKRKRSEESSLSVWAQRKILCKRCWANQVLSKNPTTAMS